MNRLRKFLPDRLYYKYKIYPLETMELSIRPEDFIEKTRLFVDRILIALGLDINKNIVLDQPFPGNNPKSCMKYFRDSKAIIVERDPRDYYVLVKKYYSKRAGAVPHDTVENFIKFYKLMHFFNHENDDENILIIQFEDMIYQYENTKKCIVEFLNLKNHNYPKRYFNPTVSAINTQLFSDYPNQNEIRKIEEELSEYLYNFSEKPNLKKEGKVFDESPTLYGYEG